MENSVSRPRQTLLLFETLCITTSCNTGLARVGVDVCNRERQTMLLRTLWKKNAEKNQLMSKILLMTDTPKFFGKAGKQKQALKLLTEQDSHKMLKAQIH